MLPWLDGAHASGCIVQHLVKQADGTTCPAVLLLQLLDLGSGYGGTAVHIAERLGCRATGVNISPFQVRNRARGECSVLPVVGRCALQIL